MSDLIRVVDLEVQAHIGVPEAERRQPQRLLVSLSMSVESFVHAAATDNVARTINYFEVAERIKGLVAERPRKLLEALAEELAMDLLKSFPVKKLTLEIKKFILPDARYVSVEIQRSSNDLSA
jgi:dihydroneopterin aldolase